MGRSRYIQSAITSVSARRRGGWLRLGHFVAAGCGCSAFAAASFPIVFDPHSALVSFASLRDGIARPQWWPAHGADWGPSRLLPVHSRRLPSFCVRGGFVRSHRSFVFGVGCGSPRFVLILVVLRVRWFRPICSLRGASRRSTPA